eukprot:TRINITY_DN21967_c0_g1_i1.p2 TRINITY_DN21967_c0_g1~~TRINITY_DN21967_c0_g1_i1.p2  ORF type:complete len:108 (+),score=22.43 TRINITY_DN21967_c0_g1_i1:36-326(+)
MVSDHIKSDPSTYAPFLDETTPLDTYTTTLLAPTHWGGDIELQALSTIFSTAIHVIQSPAPNQTFGTGPHPPIYITYHRHYHILSAHYNATAPLDS